MENIPVSALVSALLSLSNPATDVVTVYELPAIAGLWQIDLSQETDLTQKTNAQKPRLCQERYNFGKNGALITTSAKEYTEGQYRFDYISELPLPVLAMKTTYDNNQPDCLGNSIDQTGDTMAVFVKLDRKHNPKTMQWCSDLGGQDCTSTLYRILP